MNSSSDTQGLDLLFKKLGHSIVEIRSRALDSILSKLEHGLIHDADLVQEKQLFIRLLEWFNMQPTPKQDKVLELLIRLSKHSSACDCLVSIGAMQFFTRLRSEIDTNVKPQVDVLIDRLLQVTDRDVLRSMSQNRCVYGTTAQENGKQDPPTPKDQQLNYGYFTNAIDSSANETVTSSIPPVPQVTRMKVDFYCNATEPLCLKFAGFPWHSLTSTDRHVLASTGASLCSSSAHLVRNACAFLLDVIFRDFPPEIFLQRPSIVQTILTLISSRPGGKLMTGALECLQSLSESLIARLHFFQDPALYCPRQGLPFHGDNRSGSVTPQRSFPGSQGSRSEGEGAVRPVRSGGDGRDDRSSSSSSSATTSTHTMLLSHVSSSHAQFQHNFGAILWNSSEAEDDLEQDVQLLQRSQLTAPQFCLSALISTLPSLKTESTLLALNLLQSSRPLIHLLSKSIKPEKLWTDKSTLAQNLQAQLRQLLETMGDCVMFHSSSDDCVHNGVRTVESGDWVERKRSRVEGRMHRLVYVATVAMAMKILRAVLPVEESQKEIKSSLGRALFVVSCDEALRISCSDDYELAHAYLEQCNADKFGVVTRMMKVVSSFSHMHSFIQDSKESPNFISMETMELAESSLDSLPYHNDVKHIKFIVAAVSRVYLQPNNQLRDIGELQKTGKRVLLRMLAHPLVRIRRSSYEECLALVRAGVNVNAAAENPGNLSSAICKFLLDSEVLYEICGHGLGDMSRLVSYPAQELIAVLLQGRLLMAAEIWEKFCDSVKSVLPVLQAYTGETEILRSAVDVFLSPSEHPDKDWSVDAVHACLRGLMLKHRGSRSSAATRLQQVLEKDDLLQHVSGLTDLLVVDTPLSLIPRDETDCFRIRHCVFQEDAVVRMLSVYRSTSTETSVRIGALRQLATMLDDQSLHKIFIANRGLDSVVSKLGELAGKEVDVIVDEQKPAMSSCITILKLVLRKDAASRECHAHNLPLLVTLLRCASLTRLSVASLSDVSVVIALLVFHDILREYRRPASDNVDGKGPVELSLPASVVARYQIPFLCPTHHAVSVHRTLVNPPSLSCDLLVTGPPASALRLSWNLSMHDGDVVAVVENNKDDATSNSIYFEDVDLIDLRLTESDVISLQLSHPSTSSSSLIGDVVASKSHGLATRAFSLLQIAMMSSRTSLRFVEELICLQEDKWKNALGKFLIVLPTCYEDELMLIHLTALLNNILSVLETQHNDLSDKVSTTIVQWFLQNCLLCSGKDQQILGITGSPLLKVLESSEPQPEPVIAPGSTGITEPHTSSVTVRRQLCKKILSLLSRVSRLLFADKSINGEMINRFHRELRTVILVRLRLADAPQFYDLPSMEVTLECLVHLSATRVAHSNVVFNVDPTDRVLLQQLLSTLLEIVSAFHVGSGASSLSYMGKGVSRCATLCILHLTREMAALGINDWPNILEYSIPTSGDHQNHIAMETMGLEWLVPLWSARDPRTRFAGLAISQAASLTKKGSVSLLNGFQRCPGGIWSMTVCVLLDHSECSMVREQAALLLANLISHKFDGPDVSGNQYWQGPVVQHETSTLTMTGLPALLSLLHHSHIYDHFLFALTRYHPDSTVMSPAVLSNAAHINAGAAISLASVAGSGSSIQSNMTPLTQPSIQSNAFPSVSSTNKETFLSSQATSVMTDHIDSSEHQEDHREEKTSSPLNSFPEEWRALSSPSLISSICHFLINLISLAPRDSILTLTQRSLFHSLNDLLDADRIKSIFAKLNFSHPDEDVDVARKSRRTQIVRSLISQHERTIKLISSAALAEKIIAEKFVVSDENFVKNIVAVLSLEAIDPSWKEIIQNVQKTSLECICILIHQNMKNTLSTAFVREWGIYFDAVSRILKEKSSKQLHTHCLQSLALLFRSENITKTFKSDSEVSLTWVMEKRKGLKCEAEEVCLLLVNLVEVLITKPSAGINGEVNDQLTSTTQALQNLFACSKVAQTAALQAGFLERCLEEMKRLHIRMSLLYTTSTGNKGSFVISNNSKSHSSIVDDCEAYVRPILLLTNLLTNLLNSQNKAKIQAVDSGLGQILNNLWPWTSMFPNLSIALVRLVVTFTADCEKAGSSLANSYSSGHLSVANQLVRSCKKMQGVVLTRCKIPPSSLHLNYSALINASSAQETRAVIWKANILESFAQVADRGQHPKRSKQQSSLLEHWLKLLIALSLHTDGQLNILKVRDVFDILIGLYNSKYFPGLVLIIIRNLCFHAPSKNRISSNKALVRLLMVNINDENSPDAKLTTSSAILALLYNSQKAKVHLKGAGLTQNIQNALAKIALAENNNSFKGECPYQKSLHNVLDIMHQ